MVVGRIECARNVLEYLLDHGRILRRILFVRLGLQLVHKRLVQLERSNLFNVFAARLGRFVFLVLLHLQPLANLRADSLQREREQVGALARRLLQTESIRDTHFHISFLLF